MSEIASVVFDLVNPSPMTLQALSSIAVAVELWRQEIGKYRKNNTSFDELPSHIATLKDAIPNLPSSTFSLIEQNVKTLGFSIFSWKMDHSFYEINILEIAFGNVSKTPNVLNDFDDFVCDFDGSIDYVGTAKRMMLCDKLTNHHKFKIACKYCLESDILRLWPSVSDEIDLDKINFSKNPLLYYWICCLRNELYKISVSACDSIDEKMLNILSALDNWSSLSYFWNRVNVESQWRVAVKLFDKYSMYQAAMPVFARYLLQKWDELSVEKFIAEKGGELINLLLYSSENKYVIPVWMYVKNRINESNFIKIIERCLDIECIRDADLVDSKRYPNERTLLYCEIWKTAPDNLKRSVIENFMLKDEYVGFREDPEPNRDITFLSKILSYASLEERNVFWRKKWSNLIVGTQPTYLNQLMSLCFENENQIIEFKRNFMSKYENIGPYCVQLLENSNLVAIDNFLNFCCLDVDTKRNLKQQLLQSNFLGEDSILKPYHLGRNYSLTDFINDAYGGADLAADFKSELFTTPAIFKCLKNSIHSYDFSDALELLNMSLFSEPVAEVFKIEFLNGLKRRLVERSTETYTYTAESLQKILLWCLGSAEKITEFKKTLPPVEEIFHKMVQEEKLQSKKMFTMMALIENSSTAEDQADKLVSRYPRHLDQFLNWYFDTPEDIAEFRKKFSDVFATFGPIPTDDFWM